MTTAPRYPLHRPDQPVPASPDLPGLERNGIDLAMKALAQHPARDCTDESEPDADGHGDLAVAERSLVDRIVR